MEYLYRLPNATLTLRVIERLRCFTQLPLEFITVIHRIDGWMIRVRLHDSASDKARQDLKAFLNEVGVVCHAGLRLRMAFWALETGQPPEDVMRRHHVIVVSHGKADRFEIEAFRNQFVKGLGYCPETLA